jgi:hypothetical protein
MLVGVRESEARLGQIRPDKVMLVQVRLGFSGYARLRMIGHVKRAYVMLVHVRPG